MTNTLTTDVVATIKQINEIQKEGADLVRVSCPDESSSKALKEIVKHIGGRKTRRAKKFLKLKTNKTNF